jgi:hypothetical protein
MTQRFGKRKFSGRAPPIIATQNPGGVACVVQGVLGKKLLVKLVDDIGQVH